MSASCTACPIVRQPGQCAAHYQFLSPSTQQCCPSLCHVLVLYQNGSTSLYTFFSLVAQSFQFCQFFVCLICALVTHLFFFCVDTGRPLTHVLEVLKYIDRPAFHILATRFRRYAACVGVVDTGYFRRRRGCQTSTSEQLDEDAEAEQLLTL